MIKRGMGSSRPIRYLSLFSGLGGFECGIHTVFPAARCLGYCEVDEPCRRVYEGHFGDHPCLGDVRAVDFTQFAGQTDLVVGGPPCKDLSGARAQGRDGRDGLEGKESSLFWQLVRCLRECRPRWFVVENVASMRPGDAAAISQALGVEPVELNSAAVSAQHRRRLFWCNFSVPPMDSPSGAPLLKQVIEGGNTPLWLPQVLEPLATVEPYQHSAQMLHTFFDEPLVLRGQPTTKSRYETFGHYHDSRDAKSKCLGSFIQTSFNNVLLDWRRRGPSRPPLTPSSALRGHGVEKEGVRPLVRRLTPREAERLQGFADDYTGVLAKTQRYRTLGNAVTVPVIVYIMLCLARYELKM